MLAWLLLLLLLLLLLQVASTSADFQPDERDPEVELVLTENDYTLKMWPYKFKAVSEALLRAVNVLGIKGGGGGAALCLCCAVSILVTAGGGIVSRHCCAELS